jgi:protein tyrosine phosphatase (PTP) superfamily phosphohydrolase (DUF442 family)
MDLNHPDPQDTLEGEGGYFVGRVQSSVMQTRSEFPRLVLFILVLPLLGCGTQPSPPQAVSTSAHSNSPTKTAIPGLENTFQISPTLYCGNSPETKLAFDALRTLGVKTIISVDGAVPHWEWAEERGIRYIHIPMGYDGIGPEQKLKLAKAIHEVDGPVYVHCHHGKHRGPAAAMFMHLCVHPSWTQKDAEEFLASAGTDPHYAGLYRAIRQFEPIPTEHWKSNKRELPKFVKGPDLVQRMIAMDDHWSEIKTLTAKDISKEKRRIAELILLLQDDYTELHRANLNTDHGFKEFVMTGLSAVHALRETQLESVDLKKRLEQVSRNCTGCHRQFRDNR